MKAQALRGAVMAAALATVAIAAPACGRKATDAQPPSAAPQPAVQTPSPAAAPPAAAADSGSHPVPVSTTGNKAAELHVDRYEIASTFDARPAPSGHQFVVVTAHWKNILAPVEVSDSDLHPDATNGAGGLGAGSAPPKSAGSGKTHTVYMPYLIPDIATQLQLIVNGESGAKLLNEDFKDPDLLPSDSQRIEHAKDVAGRYVFDAPAPITSLELAYFDNAYGNIRVPIAGTAPAARVGAIAGPSTSGGLTLSVMKVDETDAVGDAHAPAGTRFVVLTLSGQGAATVGDNYLQIDPASDSRLVENDGHVYAPAQVEGADDVWNGTVQFVPGTPQRGRIVFTVPAPHGPLALSVAVPGEPAPMRLALSAAAAGAPRTPGPIATVPDGSTAVFYVYGVRRARSFGTATAAADAPFVIVDLGVDNRTGSGIEFQTKEQLGLQNGDATITATDEDLAAWPRSLPENGVVPPHTLGRFEIPFRVPTNALALTLHYRGFDAEKTIPLPQVR